MGDSSSTTVRRGAPGARTRRAARGAAPPALAVLLAIAVLGLVACGGSASTGGSGDGSSGGEASGGGAPDSFLQAYPTALEAIADVAGDAVLLSAGTGGLAFADVPSNWSYSFFSPANGHVYMVYVEHGKAGEPRDFGEAAAGTRVTDSLDVETIEVGGAEAVVNAREHGEQSGKVPKNVVVGGTFALTESSAEVGLTLGVWTVTFATGTDAADAQSYDVDMMTGAVTASKAE